MMRITEKGQVTIPAEIRERFGFLPHTEVDFIIDVDGVRLVRAEDASARGERIVERLRNSAKVTMSTDEILALTRRS